MAKQTEGEITIKLRVSAKGHQTANDFRSMIKDTYGVFAVHNVTIVDDTLKHSTTKAVVDQAARDLNTIRKILKQALPEKDIYHFLEGDKQNVSMTLWTSHNPIEKTDRYNSTWVGNFTIKDGDMVISQHCGPSAEDSLSMADPKFMKNLEALIILRYRTQRQRDGA